MSGYKIQTLFYLSIVSLFLMNCSGPGIPLHSNGQFLAKEETLQKPTSTPSVQSLTKKKWQAANFHGLVMGKAKVSDLRKVFGEPLQIVDLTSVGDNDHMIYHLETKEEVNGKTLAWINKKTKTIVSIEIRPDSTAKAEILKYFGDDYVITKYSSSDCPDTTFDSAPLYEDPNGETKFIEYRDRGIAILISGDEVVQYISYLSEPVGSKFSKCK